MTNERDKGGGLFDTLREIHDRYIDTPTRDWAGARDSITRAFNRYVREPVSNTVSAVVDGGASVVGSAWDGVSGVFNNTVSAVVDGGASVVDSVRNGISGLFNNTVQAFMEMLWDGALRFVGSIVGGENSSLGGWFYEAAAQKTFISEDEETPETDHREARAPAAMPVP